jgi:transcriptional regulator with XRE-family HTH domain
MLSAAQLRAARALIGLDQKTLAERAGVSLPTIQRMEASDGNVRGNVDTLTKVVAALEAAGVELIGEHARSEGVGRGVRLRERRQSEPARGRATSDDERGVGIDPARSPVSRPE